jgi:hypothetical protein
VTSTVTVTANFAVLPTVTIAGQNGQVIVSWDTSDTPWVLEQTPDWTLIPAVEYVTNGTRVLYFVASTNDVQWFRLSRP